MSIVKRTRAQESRAAIERLYIIMRHLFIRGSYKPLGVSGHSLIQALLTLRPEIYGSIADDEKVELKGLLYVLDRLPKGIEQCRYIKLITREGLELSNFDAIIPSKRRRNCYRIDEDTMYIELTRGRSDIYDILTHLTFLNIESEKIRKNSLDQKGRPSRNWAKLGKMVQEEINNKPINEEVACTYLSNCLGRTYEETVEAFKEFASSGEKHSLLQLVYWLGKISMEEDLENKDREISFSSALRERIGHHVFGEIWASNIKETLYARDLHNRPMHIISANLHSILNSLYAFSADKNLFKNLTIEEIAMQLSSSENKLLQEKVKAYALKNGLLEIEDVSGTNLTVQIIDTTQIDWKNVATELQVDVEKIKKERPVIFVMDYAFGEQAFETMDELLKPFTKDGKRHTLKVETVTVMGKAGILTGDKGDIMVPTAHIHEGTADNYFFNNVFTKSDFEGHGLGVVSGPMVTVLGTSLQNKDVLTHFLDSSWRAIGLEMEGAHYQKAIQSASKIRKSIKSSVKVMYAYYASDNPVQTGKTLASGSLGIEGVRPTYLISTKFLEKILN